METRVTHVKHMKAQRSGRIGSGGTSLLLCLFVDIKRERSGDYTRACTTFGLVKTESDTSKIHEGELCRGKFVHRTNDLNTFGEGQLLG